MATLYLSVAGIAVDDDSTHVRTDPSYDTLEEDVERSANEVTGSDNGKEWIPAPRMQMCNLQRSESPSANTRNFFRLTH